MASDQNQKKKEEGLEHIRQAEKCMKTSFLKWKPDLDGAAAEYAKAATCFRNAKLFEEAKDAYIKAAETNRQMNSSYEQAGLLCKENKQIEDAVNLMELAARLFQEHGTPDTAALTYDKAAKMVEMSYPDKSADLYIKACDVSEVSTVVPVGKTSSLYDEAIDSFKKEIEFYSSVENFTMINKIVLGVTLIYLDQGDPVAAEQFFQGATSCTCFIIFIDLKLDRTLCYFNRSLQRTPGFGTSEEAMAVEEILQAYNNGDEDAVRAVLQLPLIKYMDNAFAKIARDLIIPPGISKQPSQSNQVDGVVSEQIAKAQLDDDEDFDEGLC
ncbi:hypothetical protein KUTeg_018871 [Tegillarca granosa]|uniref:Gamma-soluble NSF attachment protein n=1 Tax=Tegillarca granosa TaxID=220873 RepID=A0ABQ9EGC6_TEGGR|nr:hypothetical protein KUTeg_018871 [Tegillarca granosa]